MSNLDSITAASTVSRSILACRTSGVKYESPFAAGDCFCGAPNCNGHEMIDGKIEIPSHPLGHVIIHKGSQA